MSARYSTYFGPTGGDVPGRKIERFYKARGKGETRGRIIREKGLARWWILKILRFLLIIIVVAIFIGIIVFGVLVYRSGSWEYFYKHASPSLRKVLDPINSFFDNLYQLLVVDPGSVINKPTTGGVAEAEVDRFIEMSRPNLREGDYRAYYFVDRPIDVKSRCKAEDLTQDTRIEIGCELEDYDGSTSFEILGKKNLVIEASEKEQKFEVRCIFEGGISEKSSKNGKIKIKYGASAESSWVVDSIHSRYKDKFDLKPQDTELAYNSPLYFQFGFYGDYPFNEDIVYTLAIEGIEKNPESGKIFRINSLELYIPPNVQLFVEDPVCDFVKTNEQDGYGNSVYRLSDDYLKDINVDCSKIEDGKYTESQCNKRKEELTENLIARCDFMYIDVPPIIDAPKEDVFRAKAEYVYQVETSFIVDIRESFMGSPGVIKY
jgi:hypothetical protein